MSPLFLFSGSFSLICYMTSHVSVSNFQRTVTSVSLICRLNLYILVLSVTVFLFLFGGALTGKPKVGLTISQSSVVEKEFQSAVPLKVIKNIPSLTFK